MAEYCNLFEIVIRSGGSKAWHKIRILSGKDSEKVILGLSLQNSFEVHNVMNPVFFSMFLELWRRSGYKVRFRKQIHAEDLKYTSPVSS